MTKKQVEKLKQWKSPKIITGNITLFPSALKYLKTLSQWDFDCIDKYKVLYIYSDHMGFTINENSISCKKSKYSNVASEKVNIPFNYIQKVYFYGFNNGLNKYK